MLLRSTKCSTNEPDSCKDRLHSPRSQTHQSNGKKYLNSNRGEQCLIFTLGKHNLKPVTTSINQLKLSNLQIYKTLFLWRHLFVFIIMRFHFAFTRGFESPLSLCASCSFWVKSTGRSISTCSTWTHVLTVCDTN